MPDTLDRPLIKVSLVLLTGGVAALLESTMVSVALADLGVEFGSPVSDLQLVSTAYLLAMAIAIPLVGWLVDRWGARTAWLLANGLFLAGASGSFFALPSAPWLGVGTLLTLAFAVSSYLQSDRALFDLRFVRHRPYAAASSLAFLFGIAIYGPLFLLPLYFQWVLGDAALAAGAMLAFQGAGTMLAIALAGRWSDQAGPRPVILSGMSVTALATLAFHGLDAAANRSLLALSLFVRGMGLGVVLHRRLAASAAVEATEGAANITEAFSGAFMWTVAFTLVALIPALTLPRWARAAEIERGRPVH